MDNYYSPADRDSLLADIITYIYIKPTNANDQTRFEPKFRSYYIQQLNKFRLTHYFVNEKGVHYYYLIRPARSPEGNVRGVGGSFRKDAGGKIVSFREIFNTPVADEQTLLTRGNELFLYLIKKGEVNDFLRNPDYIQWPDAQTGYDTINHKWTVKPGV